MFFIADASLGAHSLVGTRAESVGECRVYLFQKLWWLAYHGDRMFCWSTCRILSIHWC